jgi:hypothetical protein
VRALLTAGFQEADHFGDALGALLWSAFGGVDPAQVGASVELGEGVEERGGLRVGVECGGDVVGQVAALGSLGLDVDGDGVAGGETTAAEPGGAEREAEPVAAGSMTPRSPMPLTVPWMWCRGLAPQTSSGSNGTGIRTWPRLAVAAVAVNC